MKTALPVNVIQTRFAVSITSIAPNWEMPTAVHAVMVPAYVKATTRAMVKSAVPEKISRMSALIMIKPIHAIIHAISIIISMPIKPPVNAIPSKHAAVNM